MTHINHRVHKWQVRDMQRQALYGALRAAKQPQDYAAAKRIGVIPNVSAKIQNRVPGD